MLKKERVDISDVDSVAFMLERQKVRSCLILLRKCLDVIQPTHLTEMELKRGLLQYLHAIEVVKSIYDG